MTPLEGSRVSGARKDNGPLQVRKVFGLIVMSCIVISESLYLFRAQVPPRLFLRQHFEFSKPGPRLVCTNVSDVVLNGTVYDDALGKSLVVVAERLTF